MPKNTQPIIITKECMDSILKRIGDCIRKTRREKGFTQEQLSERLGLTPETIGNWENARVLITTEHLIKISLLLGLDLDYIVHNKDRSSSCKIYETLAK